MHHLLLLILGLLLVVFLLVMVAQRIRIAYPIFLVIAGLGISFIPGVPQLHLNPELIFLLFLPPLLYEAAWYTSWNDFWKWKRPIALLAFGLVFITSTVVAYTASYLIPGMTLALGFLLGGIVSPPDAVAASSVLKNMKVPKRIMTILEGESLVNDASSLIVFKFALAAIVSGTFSLQMATGQFFWVSGMGILIGLIGGHIMYAIHRFLPTTPPIDAALSVMTPYMLFLAAEQFHFSGVMAVVTGGLFMSYRAHEIFNTGSTRLNMLGVWTTMIFVMNALVFILIGLELPEIIQGLGAYSIADGIRYGIIISLITILIRFLWVFPIAHIPRWLSARVRQDPSPGWKGPLVISWSGMRGVVSLATALSIPLLLTDDIAFPQRNLIIFITFVVIFITLVLQGLTLPLLLRIIRLEEIDPKVPESDELDQIKFQLDALALQMMGDKYPIHSERPPYISAYMYRMEKEMERIEKRMHDHTTTFTSESEIQSYKPLFTQIFRAQRKELFKMRQQKRFQDEHIRKAELRIDLEELKIIGTSH